TQKQAGDILPVVITVYKDKSFTFITKSPPAAVLLKKAANIAAGSKEPNKTKVRSEEHTSELQSPDQLVCRLLLEKKKKQSTRRTGSKGKGYPATWRDRNNGARANRRRTHNVCGVRTRCG